MAAIHGLRALSVASLCCGATAVEAQSVDCQQVLFTTVPFQIEYSDGAIAQVTRLADGHMVVLNGRKTSADAANRQLFRSGYFLQNETSDSTITAKFDVDLSRNPYEARRDFFAAPTRSQTKGGVTTTIETTSATYRYVRDDQKIIGTCLLKTVVFEATLAGRCGDRDMPTVLHHHSLELRTTIASSGQFCRNGEYATFSRDAVSLQTTFQPLIFRGR